MFLSRLPEKYAMAGRNAQVARIYTILDLLEGAPHGLTVAELWDRVKDRGHEVSRRTVYRDLEALNDAGFPLFSEGADESARWKLERDARVAQYLVLSARELFALYLARESLMSLKGTVFYQDLVTAFGKIEGKLGAKGREYLEELSREVRVDSLPRWNFGLSAELVDTVRAAAAEGHVMEVTYRSAHTGGSERRRRLGGQFVYLAKGGVYLVAEDLESHEVKVFALARMRDAVMTAEPYGGVAVDPERFFGDSMGVFRGGAAEKVTLVFSPPVACVAEGGDAQGWKGPRGASSGAHSGVVAVGAGVWRGGGSGGAGRVAPAGG